MHVKKKKKRIIAHYKEFTKNKQMGILFKLC